MPDSAVLRLRQGAVCLLLLVLAFHQSAGLISNDTKLDLTADPGRFLQRALDLWNPSSAFGQLQNQAYGYLWPMGPFHLLGASVGMPAWVVQRSWFALLLIVCFLGVLRLAARLELGTAHTRLLGGLAYALAPRVLTELGGNSSEVLPVALLPWVLVPLVGVAALERPRTAAMRSGVAVLCMGAVNAAAVLALLALPALWLAPGLRHAAGRRLTGWWLAAVALASAWWFVPLLLQGRYSPRFLDYIETAATTTGTSSAGEVLRGTSHWLGYVAVGGQPWWRSGWVLVTNGGVILVTALVSVMCVAGLLRRAMPAQGRLLAAAALGLVVMSAAHAGPLHGLFDASLRDFLDGAGAPFRNVHKFDALVRLPLALGLCHLLALSPTGRPRALLAALVTIGLVGTSAPALAGQLVPAGGYASLPSWWIQAGQWLDEHDTRSRALVVPASGFGEYLWGRPLDNPLQALTRTSWAVRDAVPLGSPGTTRLLDAIEARLDTGVGSPALAAVLARSGVRYLVVSNDLDPLRTGAPRPVLVHQALATSPGLRRVAAFGPEVGGTDTKDLVSDDGLNVGYPALEVYAVQGTGSPVASLPTAATWRVSGGPESLFALADRGLLGDTATVLAGDGDAGPSPRSVVTDDLRRREVGFGSVRNNASATLTATQPLTRKQAAADVLPVPGVEHLATARVIGAAAVRASSSAADAGALFDRGPDRQAFSAFDGDPATGWVSGGSQAAGQWVQVDLDRPLDPAGTTVTPFHDAQVRGVITTVTVRTDQGERSTALAADEVAQVVAVPPGTTGHLRVTVTSVTADGFGTLAGLREVTVPGLVVQTTIALPVDQVLTRDPVFLLDRAVGARPGCVEAAAVARCSPALPAPGEDVVRLDRTIELASPLTLPVSGTARPVAGAALDALLDKDNPVQVSASSRLVADPRQRPGTVVDNDPATGWIASANDPAPALALAWSGARPVASVRLITDPSLAAGRPTKVEVTAEGVTRQAAVPADGLVRFPSVLTNRVVVRIVTWEQRVSYGRDGSAHRLPTGLSEVSVPGLQRAPAQPAEVQLPCGQGPPVAIDGVPHPTTVLGTRADLLAQRPMLLSVCDSPGGLVLSAGSHRLVGAFAGGVQVEGLTVGSPLASAATQPRPTTVTRWDSEHRAVAVGSGQESYLVVHENHNRGWRAVLSGQQLRSVRLDGWQQAWVVPAGAGGLVRLDFTPGRTFHQALLLGGLLVLLLLALALLPSRPRPVGPLVDADLPPVARGLLGLTVGALLGGLAGAACVLLVTAVVLLVRRRADPVEALVGVYGGALAAAGLLTALAPWNGSRPPGAFSSPVQLLVLVGVAAVAAVVTVQPLPSAASAPTPVAPRAEG